MPNVLSPRDLVSRPDKMDETAPHTWKLKRSVPGRLLVNCVPIREQRTAKLTLNSMSDILKLIPLFTVSSQKVTVSNVVN